MVSYENGQWLNLNDCPACWAVRVSQGFKLPVYVLGELCDACVIAKADAEFRASPEYVAWIASIPVGLTMEEMRTWYADHPTPSFLDIGKV